jgi:hypothetical protein
MSDFSPAIPGFARYVQQKSFAIDGLEATQVL